MRMAIHFRSVLFVILRECLRVLRVMLLQFSVSSRAAVQTAVPIGEGTRMCYLLRMANQPIDPGVDIGHVHLKVADLDRALQFYRDVLGFEETQRLGHSAAFLSAGGYHHHIGLNTWESQGGTPPPRGTTGLYHVAIRYPTRAALADALRRVLAAGITLDGASDHGVSEALYLRDPDQNGVELYWDRPKDEWPRAADGGLAMTTKALNLPGLLASS